MKAYIEPYVPQMRDDVVNLKLREADIEELRAATGESPEVVLAKSLDASDITYVIKSYDRILGVFGVTPHAFEECYGVPWLLMTEEVVSSIRFPFLFGCKSVIQMFHSKYPHLLNLIDSRQTKYMRWLTWLGFTVNKNTPYLLHDPNIPFYLFYKEAP